MSRFGTSRRAFTLVELLVVIGIIALLVAILLPALTAAKRYSEQMKCASNLRTVGQVMHMYANENKGWIPLDYWHTDQYLAGHIFWAESFAKHLNVILPVVPPTPDRDRTLAPYLAKIEVYQCPSHPNPAQPLDHAINGTYKGGSTGMVRLTKMRNAAAVVYLTEANARRPVDYFMQNDIFDASHLPTSPPGSTTLNPNSRMLNDMRHRGMCNALFFDGHVAAKHFRLYTMKDFTISTN